MNTLRTRRRLAFFIISSIVVVAAILSATACEGPLNTWISAAGKTVAPGETFTIDVIVSPAPSVAIAGAQFDLRFDPAMFTAVSVTEGDLLNQACGATFFRGGTIDNMAGSITDVVCVVTNPGCFTFESGTIATITFTARDATGTSMLELLNVIVGNSAGNALKYMAVLNGSMTVSSQSTPTPVATPTPTITPTPVSSCVQARDAIQAAIDAYHIQTGEWPAANGLPGDIDWVKLVPDYMESIPGNDALCDWRVNSQPEGAVCIMNQC